MSLSGSVAVEFAPMAFEPLPAMANTNKAAGKWREDNASRHRASKFRD